MLPRPQRRLKVLWSIHWRLHSQSSPEPGTGGGDNRDNGDTTPRVLSALFGPGHPTLRFGEAPSISKKISSCCTERANPQVTSNTSNRQRYSRYLQVSLDPFKRWTLNFPAPAALPPLNPAAAFRSSPWCPQRRSGVGELKCPSGNIKYLWISMNIYEYLYE